MSLTNIPGNLNGTVQNGATWQGTDYAYQPSLQSGTKYYYKGNNPNLGTTNHIYWDTSDNTWNDDGTGNPFAFRVGTAGSETPAESALPSGGNNEKSHSVSSGDSVLVYRESPLQICFTFTQPAGLYATSGPIGTLSGGTSPEIKDVAFIKVTDSIVYLSFNWQNVNTAFLFVDSGGTVSQTNIALGGAGQSGTIAGSGYLTGLNDGDRCWIANTDAVYIHKIVHWSKEVVSGTKSVIAKCFGESGFQFRITNTLGENTQYVSHTGNELSLSASLPSPAKKVTWQVWKYKASPLTLAKYGSSFTTLGGKVFSNFW